MTYEVQQTRWDRLIRRVSGSIGPGSRVSETISELFPVLDVESVPAELLALSGTALGWGRVISPAVPVENARAQLFNPENSGKLVTITDVWIIAAADGTAELGILQVPLADLSAVGQFRDSRFGVTFRPVAELRSDSNVGANPAIFRVRTFNTDNTHFFTENSVAVLSPGFGLVISNTTVNTSITVGFVYRERVAEQSELSF